MKIYKWNVCEGIRRDEIQSKGFITWVQVTAQRFIKHENLLNNS